MMKNDPVVIKGSREGIFLLLDPEMDFVDLKEKISRKLSESKEFLVGAQLICDFGIREVTAEQIAEIEAVIKSFKLKLKRINNSRREEKGMQPNQVDRNSVPTNPHADERTVLINKTLRSGQTVNFDGNVVVMGDVNPGAEVVATGNVIVMGALRGVVHAGAKGNHASVVTAIRLKPTQLRIADQITRAPDDDADGPDVPEIARLKDGVVTIERYVPSERQARAR